MSVGVGVDVGASVVKVATADATSARPTHVGARETSFPDLISRVGTRVPHVGLNGHDPVTRYAHDLFVEEILQAIHRSAGSELAAESGVAVIAPDWWTPRACESVRAGLIEAGMAEAYLVSSAVAAVQGYRAVVPSMPDTVAVLDLGAHTCSAAIVTGCQTDELRRVGHPTAVHGRGGADLDARLLHHVLDGLRSQGLTYSHDDDEAVSAARALLAECRSAKEALSVRPVITLSPRMPGATSQFRLVRAEHDDLARPAVREIVQALKDCIAGSGLDIDAVLLAGGGAPSPIVTQLISVELGLPVLLDDDPSTLSARGAAIVAALNAPVADKVRRPGLIGAWLTRPRPERAADPDRHRHRGSRAGAAAAYIAIALAVAAGAPSSSVAQSGGGYPDPAPAAASQETDGRDDDVADSTGSDSKPGKKNDSKPGKKNNKKSTGSDQTPVSSQSKLAEQPVAPLFGVPEGETGGDVQP